MFTTSIAARGLDFPAVDWVVQVDCPETVESYVHKIGRTARFNAKGKSMLFLTFPEQKFVDKLQAASMFITRLKVNPERLLTVKKSLQAICSENQEIKYLGQRAVTSYLRSIYYLADKEIFDVKKINLQKFAGSYGLVQIPSISFTGDDDEDGEDEEANDGERNMQRSSSAKPTMDEEEDGKAPRTKQQKKLDKLKKKIEDRKKARQEDFEEENGEELEEEIENIDTIEGPRKTKLEAMAELGGKEGDRKNALHNAKRTKQEVKRAKMDSDSEESGDDLLITKRKDNQIEVEDMETDPFKLSNKMLKKMPKGGHFQGRNIYVFDEETGGGIFTLIQLSLSLIYRDRKTRVVPSFKRLLRSIMFPSMLQSSLSMLTLINRLRMIEELSRRTRRN